MKTDVQKSADVIDQRRSRLVTIAIAIAVTVGGWFGVRATVDPDAGLIAIVSTALDHGQAYWAARVPGYRRAQVVFFHDRVRTSCGTESSTTGPFYCPASERIYIDLSFLRDIDGDLARAYVIAHELGHHVEKLRGDTSSDKAWVELLADCLAGRWIGEERRNNQLEISSTDIAAALAEAVAVGDDRLCPSCTADQFTHGSSAMRRSALLLGINNGECKVTQ